MSEVKNTKTAARDSARRRARATSSGTRVARTGARSRLRNALDGLRDEDLVQSFPLEAHKQLLKGVGDAIEGLIAALDRYHGDADLEPEEDVGADDIGELEDRGTL